MKVLAEAVFELTFLRSHAQMRLGKQTYISDYRLIQWVNMSQKKKQNRKWTGNLGGLPVLEPATRGVEAFKEVGPVV